MKGIRLLREQAGLEHRAAYRTSENSRVVSTVNRLRNTKGNTSSRASCLAHNGDIGRETACYRGAPFASLRTTDSWTLILLRISRIFHKQNAFPVDDHAHVETVDGVHLANHGVWQGRVSSTSLTEACWPLPWQKRFPSVPRS